MLRKISDFYPLNVIKMNFWQRPKPSIFTKDVTIILNVWKRNYLEEQLDSLLAQTVRPKALWIIQYERFVNFDTVIKKYRKLIDIEHFHFSSNLKYFGRFSLANFAHSQYVWLLDDDIIPGKKWLEYSLDLIEKHNCLISCAGRIITKDNFRPEAKFHPDYHIGDCSGRKVYYNPKDTPVDFGIQSYFIKKEWLRYFWQLYPYTFETGEDIHLAATLKLNGIGCLVPMQHDVDSSGNIKGYGGDKHASWRMKGFFDSREACLKYLIEEKGWRPIQWEQT